MSPGRTLWITAFLAVLLWSAYRPFDYVIWFLEVFPALVAAAVLWFTRERFPLTTLAYSLILLHCIILMVGGHYTYALVPLGEWIQQLLDQSRNNYDKLGHLAQGIVVDPYAGQRPPDAKEQDNNSQNQNQFSGSKATH